MSNDTDHIEIKSRAEWRHWLTLNYQRTNGIWLVTYKKHCGNHYVSYDAVVEEALCFGWIDSLPRKLDADRTMLWMAPRQPNSGWSKLNKERIAKMIAADKMTPAGLAKIEAAQKDGSWNSLDAVENLEIPPDLAAALAEYECAQANFDKFPKSAKRGILEWITSAKKPATRSQRIRDTARLAQDNIRANQWRQK